MLTYTYKCDDCEHKFEQCQKITDDPLIYCPECNEPKLKRVITGSTFILKGTGWYETDFKHKQ